MKWSLVLAAIILTSLINSVRAGSLDTEKMGATGRGIADTKASSVNPCHIDGINQNLDHCKENKPVSVPTAPNSVDGDHGIIPGDFK